MVKVRLGRKIWELTRAPNGTWTLDDYEPDTEAALAVLAGKGVPWEITGLKGLADADDQGLIGDADDAARVLATARRCRKGAALRRDVTDQAVLVVASYDADRNARANVAGNPATPRAVIMRLASDPEKRVRDAAFRNPSFEAAEADREAGGLDRDVLTRVLAQTADTEFLSRFLEDPRVTIRRAVAANRNVSEDRLVGWLSHRDASVRRIAALNPAVSGLALEAWIEDVLDGKVDTEDMEPSVRWDRDPLGTTLMTVAQQAGVRSSAWSAEREALLQRLLERADENGHRGAMNVIASHPWAGRPLRERAVAAAKRWEGGHGIPALLRDAGF